MPFFFCFHAENPEDSPLVKGDHTFPTLDEAVKAFHSLLPSSTIWCSREEELPSAQSLTDPLTKVMKQSEGKNAWLEYQVKVCKTDSNWPTWMVTETKRQELVVAGTWSVVELPNNFLALEEVKPVVEEVKIPKEEKIDEVVDMLQQMISIQQSDAAIQGKVLEVQDKGLQVMESALVTQRQILENSNKIQKMIPAQTLTLEQLQAGLEQLTKASASSSSSSSEVIEKLNEMKKLLGTHVDLTGTHLLNVLETTINRHISTRTEKDTLSLAAQENSLFKMAKAMDRVQCQLDLLCFTHKQPLPPVSSPLPLAPVSSPLVIPSPAGSTSPSSPSPTSSPDTMSSAWSDLYNPAVIEQRPLNSAKKPDLLLPIAWKQSLTPDCPLTNYYNNLYKRSPKLFYQEIGLGQSVDAFCLSSSRWYRGIVLARGSCPQSGKNKLYVSYIGWSHGLAAWLDEDEKHVRPLFTSTPAFGPTTMTGYVLSSTPPNNLSLVLP